MHATPALGVLLLAAYATVFVHYARIRRLENVLWICHSGALVLAIGLVAGQPSLAAVGSLLVTVGVPTWALYALGGGELIWPSVFSHLFSFLVAVVAIRELGVPAGSWLIAWAFTMALHVACRRVSSLEENVNLGAVLWKQGERTVPHGYGASATASCLVALVYWSLETLLNRQLAG